MMDFSNLDRDEPFYTVSPPLSANSTNWSFNPSTTSSTNEALAATDPTAFNPSAYYPSWDFSAQPTTTAPEAYPSAYFATQQHQPPLAFLLGQSPGVDLNHTSTAQPSLQVQETFHHLLNASSKHLANPPPSRNFALNHNGSRKANGQVKSNTVALNPQPGFTLAHFTPFAHQPDHG